MNILFFMNHYPDSRNGGIENVTRILSGQFVNLGHSVHIRYLLDSNFSHSDDSIFVSCEQIDKKDILRQIHDVVKVYAMDILINQGMLFTTPILRESIKELPCKLITAYHGQPTISPLPLEDILFCKDIPTLKKIILSFTYPLFVYRSKRKQRKRCQSSYYLSDSTVLLSELHIPEYSKLVGIDRGKLTYMNNPIREDFTSEPKDLKTKENTILIVSRLDNKEKRIIKSLKIWRKVVKAYPNWKLQVVGSGPDELSIREYAQSHHVKNVEFYSARNPLDYYKKAAFFLMTSRSEGWGCTLTEAMNFGCIPLAIGCFTAVKDIIDNGENGIIVPKSNEKKEVGDCASAIIGLISDVEKQKFMAINACKKAELYSAEVIAKRWISLFEELIARG